MHGRPYVDKEASRRVTRAGISRRIASVVRRISSPSDATASSTVRRSLRRDSVLTSIFRLSAESRNSASWNRDLTSWKPPATVTSSRVSCSDILSSVSAITAPPTTLPRPAFAERGATAALRFGAERSCNAHRKICVLLSVLPRPIGDGRLTDFQRPEIRRLPCESVGDVGQLHSAIHRRRAGFQPEIEIVGPVEPLHG